MKSTDDAGQTERSTDNPYRAVVDVALTERLCEVEAEADGLIREVGSLLVRIGHLRQERVLIVQEMSRRQEKMNDAPQTGTDTGKIQTA